MTKSSNAKVFAFISAILCAVFSVKALFEAIFAIINAKRYPTDALIHLIVVSLVLVILAIALFTRNKITLAIGAGTLALYFIYCIVRAAIELENFSLNWLAVFIIVAYLTLLALAIMAHLGNQVVKYLWFLPGLLLLVGYLYQWIDKDYFSVIGNFYETIWLSLIEITAITFAGLWLSQDISPARAPRQNAYAPQQNAYAPQQNAYAQRPQNAYAPQQNAYAQRPQNAYAPQPNAYAQRPQNAYAPQPNANAQRPQNAYAQPQQSAYVQRPQSTYAQYQQPANAQPQRPAYAPQQAAPVPQPAPAAPQPSEPVSAPPAESAPAQPSDE